MKYQNLAEYPHYSKLFVDDWPSKKLLPHRLNHKQGVNVENKALEIFKFESKEIRTQIREDGQLWISAKDLCEVLDVKNVSQTLKVLDEDEKGIYTVDTLGGKQDVLMVNESGMYGLIGKSRKPAAKRFNKWVRSEVLPSIAKTGRYSIKNEGQRIITTSLEDLGLMQHQLMENVVMPIITTMHNNTLDAIQNVITVNFTNKTILPQNTPQTPQPPQQELFAAPPLVSFPDNDMVGIRACANELGIKNISKNTSYKISKLATQENIKSELKPPNGHPYKIYPRKWLSQKLQELCK